MGPGIFTRYSKQVIGVLLAILALLTVVILYYRLRSPVGGKSPYETVNDLYEWEYMTFESEQAVYPADTDVVRLRFRNDAPDGVVALAAGSSPSFGYELEIWDSGTWRQMRSHREVCRWDGRTDIVKWNGGEELLSCPVGRDYPAPLAAGRYRIVLPNCQHIHRAEVPLAAEFEVTE